MERSDQRNRAGNNRVANCDPRLVGMVRGSQRTDRKERSDNDTRREDRP
jgi:hypothetical protein